MATVDNAASDKSFKDHFSGHSSSYAEYRPTYPDALFAFLADCCTGHSLAWDCATGSGQAALALSEYFDRVIATDASEAQIREAESKAGIEYRVARAEASGLDDDSIELITVGQALHWFDIPAFLDESQRVLVEGGVLAVWSYERCAIEPACDALINELYLDAVGPYWPAERAFVEGGYRSIELPMPSISAPEFSMKKQWAVEEMLGYLRTWSASQRYMKANGSDPVVLIQERLSRAWGEGRREVSWPLSIKIGRA